MESFDDALDRVSRSQLDDAFFLQLVRKDSVWHCVLAYVDSDELFIPVTAARGSLSEVLDDMEFDVSSIALLGLDEFVHRHRDS